jgi:hypothetical protein
MENKYINVWRIVLGFIPWIGGLYILAIFMDILNIKYWRNMSIVVSILHVIYSILISFWIGILEF